MKKLFKVLFTILVSVLFTVSLFFIALYFIDKYIRENTILVNTNFPPEEESFKIVKTEVKPEYDHELFYETKLVGGLIILAPKKRYWEFTKGLNWEHTTRTIPTEVGDAKLYAWTLGKNVIFQIFCLSGNEGEGKRSFINNSAYSPFTFKIGSDTSYGFVKKGVISTNGRDISDQYVLFYKGWGYIISLSTIIALWESFDYILDVINKLMWEDPIR